MHQNHDRLVGEQRRKTFNAQVVAAIEAERPGSAAENMVQNIFFQFFPIADPAEENFLSFEYFGKRGDRKSVV